MNNSLQVATILSSRASYLENGANELARTAGGAIKLHAALSKSRNPCASILRKARLFVIIIALVTIQHIAIGACDNYTNGWINGGIGGINSAFNYWHGALGKADFCNNASIGPDRQKAKNCAWNYTVAKFNTTNVNLGCARQEIETRGKATLDEFVRLWNIASGNDCSQATIDKFFPHWKGALGKVEYCNNATIGPNREQAKGCAFQALVTDKGVSANSCLRDAIANSPQGKATLDEFVKLWNIARGYDCSQASIDKFFPHWKGALGKVEYCNNAAIGTDRDKAKTCAFQALVRDKGIAANSCLLDAIANSSQGKATLDDFIAKWQVTTGGQGNGATIATNRMLTDPKDHESCDNSNDGFHAVSNDKEILDWTPTKAPWWKIALSGYGPPASPKPEHYNKPPLHNIGGNEGRLRSDLRALAAKANPLESLCKSVIAFGMGKESDGNAMADLSVTGRRTFAAFKTNPPQAAQIIACAKRAPELAEKSDAVLQEWTNKALNRAYRVVQVVRAGGWPLACKERAALGYIAVSGEDDQPHRPTNIPSAEFQQHDLRVQVGNVTVNTRYMIAQTRGGGRSLSCADQGLRIPAEPAPVLDADAEVILYIHGMDSRLEEAMDITRVLHKLGVERNKNYTVISVDLPTSGFADNIDFNLISALSTIGTASSRRGLELGFAPNRYNAHVLDFIENFIVAFVNTLNTQVPGVTRQFRVVIGGSLGGNMAMRLGRPRVDAPWITAVVPWSPAGMWNSKADNDVEHVALTTPWTFAGGDTTYRDEQDWSRGGFFYGGFDWQSKIGGIISITSPQAEAWYGTSWACRQSRVRLARLDRYETYNANFRRWHWRLAAEQMMFSHTIKVNDKALYLSNTKRMLLMCGIEDVGGKLCEVTRSVAADMRNTPGHALFLNTTGHSIHAERPNFLGRHIADFIAPVTPGITLELDYARTSPAPRRVNAVSPATCRDICKADGLCKSYNFLRAGTQGSGCSLLNRVGEKIFNSDATSGQKQ